MMLRKQQANSAWIQEEEARKCLNQPQISPPVQPKMAPPNTVTPPVQRKTSFQTLDSAVMYLFVQLLFQMIVTFQNGGKR